MAYPNILGTNENYSKKILYIFIDVLYVKIGITIINLKEILVWKAD